VYVLDEQFTASTNAEPFLDLDLLPAFKKELKPRKVVGLAVHSWGTHLLCLARPGFFVLAPPRPNPYLFAHAPPHTHHRTRAF
jgi:hypothetical protein